MNDKKPPKGTISRQPRASITFPPKLYRILENLAREKKVSLAWIVRDAAEKYVIDQTYIAKKSQGNQI